MNAPVGKSRSSDCTYAAAAPSPDASAESSKARTQPSSTEPKFCKDHKYSRGDRVLLKTDFGHSMSHFGGKGCEALIVASYRQQYGGGKDADTSFTMLIFPNGKEHRQLPYESSWYGPENFEKLITARCDKNLRDMEEILYPAEASRVSE